MRQKTVLVSFLSMGRLRSNTGELFGEVTKAPPRLSLTTLFSSLPLFPLDFFLFKNKLTSIIILYFPM